MLTVLRIHQDVNYEIMTNHKNSDPLRLTGGVSEGCPSAPLQYLSFTAAREKTRQLERITSLLTEYDNPVYTEG